MIMATIKKAVKKVVKKATAKVVKKKVEKKIEKEVEKKVDEVVLTDCVACNGRGLETSFTLCRHCHGSGRV